MNKESDKFFDEIDNYINRVEKEIDSELKRDIENEGLFLDGEVFYSYPKTS